MMLIQNGQDMDKIGENMKNVHSISNLDKLSSRIAAVSQDEIETHKSRLEPHDTGHLHTAISVIQHRIDEIQNTH